MGILKKIHNIVKRNNGHIASNEFGLHSSCQMKKILENERALADRYFYEFSLIVFEADNLNNGNDLRKRLSSILTKRVRSTDKAGWIDESKIGVVLPYTKPEVAEVFTADINKYFNSEDNLKFKIFKYPGDWF